MSLSNEQNTIKDAREAFGELPGDEFLAECAKLCKIYSLSAAELYYKYEAMTFNQQGIKIYNADTLSALQRECQKSIQKENTVKREARGNLNGLLSRGGLMKGGGAKNAFLSSRIPMVPKAEPLDTPTVNDPLSRSQSKVEFSLLNCGDISASGRAYRYMHEKILERSEVLDDRIEEIAQLVWDHYDLGDLADPNASTEEETVVVGRVVLDSEFASTGSVKLSETTLALEPSRSVGLGHRVPLKFDPTIKIRQSRKGVDGAGFFPGAIVALRGRNGGGGWYLVTEILTLPPLRPRDIPSDCTPFSASIVCGPFSPDSDLAFGPWQTFMKRVDADKPDVLLLIGPFLDSSHPLLKQGDITNSPDAMFHQNFVEPLHEYLLSSTNALVLIVPSIRDLLSNHAAYPQRELSQELFRNHPRIRVLPNPSLFTLGGITFGISSVDVLFHLKKDEFFKRAPTVDLINSPDENGSDSMSNAVRYLLDQRSFYPIFPPPAELSHEVNLDVSHLAALSLCETLSDQCCPDVLIVPSRLKQFTKVVNDTVAVNPSFASKGTYAKLQYGGPSSSPSLRQVIQVDIVRLDT